MEEVIAALDEARALDPDLKISANTRNGVCANGVLWGRGTEVITACEQAVAQAAGKDKDRFRGARGLARAQTGDYAGAAEDLKAFMETLKGFVTYAERAPMIQAWISELEAGRNPFGSQTLQALRNDPLF